MFNVLWLTAVVMLVGASGAAVHYAPVIAAGALLHPTRVPVRIEPPPGCVDRAIASDGLALRGWSCAAASARRGTIVYLHGVADNRASSVGAVRRYTARGFDVLAYDSRGHGDSDGDTCTYGFHEKDDLRRVIDGAAPGPVVVIGTSLGAAVALQAAAGDTRISGVVAAEVFADLDTIARERAPSALPRFLIDDALALAEQQGRFRIAEVSPVVAAGRIRVPTLLIHGAEDADTPPHHSRRVFEALSVPKRLILVPDARHNESLRRAETWAEVDMWIEKIVGGQS